MNYLDCFNVLNIDIIEEFFSELETGQCRTVESSIQIKSQLIFYGCNSPDDDNFQYVIIGKDDTIILNYSFHETDLHSDNGVSYIWKFVDNNISNIKEIYIIHDHDCSSDCDFNLYVKKIIVK